MAMHPQIAKKAQVEIDAVVGNGRLPDFFDRPSLPYIDAIAKECMRWKPVANLGASLLHPFDNVPPLIHLLWQDSLIWPLKMTNTTVILFPRALLYWEMYGK